MNTAQAAFLRARAQKYLAESGHVVGSPQDLTYLDLEHFNKLQEA